MSTLQSLIIDLCPNGVPRVKIDDLIAYEQPTKYLVASKSYDDSYPTPVLTAGQSFLLGYTNEEHGKYAASIHSPVIIFDDFTTAYKWVDFEFKVKSSAMKMLTVKAGAQIRLRYFWYALSTIHIDTSEHARYWISKISNLDIPLPPLDIQDEIVRILDTFIQLEAELESELEARKSQFAHYRAHLLSTQNLETCDARKIPIGELLRLQAGKFINASRISSGADAESLYPCYGGNGSRGFVSNFSHDGEYVLIGRQGALSGNVNRTTGRFYATEHAIVVYPKEKCDVKWLYHVLTEMNLNQYVSKGAQPGLAVGNLEKVEIVVPSLEIQHKFGSILDSFDKFVNDETEGLPAEIKARRKQYEYYRNILLTFKELEVA